MTEHKALPMSNITKGDVILEVRGLAVEVQGRRILDGLDLTVRAGEVHAIMGPNGPAEVDILAQALLEAQEFFT